MTKITGYKMDVLNETLTVTDAFTKRASKMNSAEYELVLRFRRDFPNGTIVKETSKHSSSISGLSVKKMEEYIGQCRDKEARLATFKTVKALSKIQPSPYSYIKKWFLNNYANYSAQPEFDADGFVIIKTKEQVAAEKLAAEGQEPQSEEATDQPVAESNEELMEEAQKMIDNKMQAAPAIEEQPSEEAA